MKKTGLVLAIVLVLVVLLTITAGTAFATKWVEVPGTGGRLYIDADSAVIQGGTLIYWDLLIPHVGEVGRYHGVPVPKSATKMEVDLRTPRKMRWVLRVDFDVNDQQIASPFSNPNPIWESVSGLSPSMDLALSLAKEGQDTGAIPAPTSDRY